MRILMLTQWFDPEPIFKGLPFAKELVRRGHKVEVVTGFPNYPSGRIYDGYRMQMLQRETMEGVQVLRVPLYPSHNNKALPRIANYASLALSAASVGLCAARKADVVYVYHPPATIGLPAVMMKLLRGIPFVYDIQDLWPDTLQATGMMNNKAVISLIAMWSSFIYGRADRIAVLSPGFKRELVTRGVPEAKIEVIYNWCDEIQIPDPARDETLARQLGLAGRFNIVFAGNMGKAQALSAVLEAARRTAVKFPEIQFIFVGGGLEAENLKLKARHMNLQNTLFVPRQPVSEIGKIMNLADVLLVHLKDDPLFTITIPSKTQAYMAIGKPILIGVRGDAADLVVRAGAGLPCMPEDPESIAKVAGEMYSMPRTGLEEMGIKGRTFYQRELSLSVGARKFEALFQSVCRRNPVTISC